MDSLHSTISPTDSFPSSPLPSVTPIPLDLSPLPFPPPTFPIDYSSNSKSIPPIPIQCSHSPLPTSKPPSIFHSKSF